MVILVDFWKYFFIIFVDFSLFFFSIYWFFSLGTIGKTNRTISAISRDDDDFFDRDGINGLLGIKIS
jgi:hypothetical protein